jgi:hypothetical protein
MRKRSFGFAYAFFVPALNRDPNNQWLAAYMPPRFCGGGTEDAESSVPAAVSFVYGLTLF